jgi:hypothetical protein
MNKSEKEILFLRIGVNAKSAGTLLAGAALGGPLGLVVAGLGVAMAWAGNQWLNTEVDRMEGERARGETPRRPSVPR